MTPLEVSVRFEHVQKSCNDEVLVAKDLNLQIAKGEYPFILLVFQSPLVSLLRLVANAIRIVIYVRFAHIVLKQSLFPINAIFTWRILN